jgi:epoxyqueuosine reductase
MSIAQMVGFEACGVSSATLLADHKEIFLKWVSQGMNGEMSYMERNADKRLNPSLLVPGAKSVVSVLAHYFPGNPTTVNVPPKISRYALGADYHLVLKDMLHEMLNLIKKEYGGVSGRAFVDSAPVLERAWAERAGLGWIGKNGLLINQELGSYVFLGELVIDMEIEPTAIAAANRCGSCTRCMDACPTGAIVAPKVVDSRKCISYLTIEKKSPLTEDEMMQLNGWCFGCDICQEVCPWNQKKHLASNTSLKPLEKILSFNAEDILAMNNDSWEQLVQGTALERISLNKMKLTIASQNNTKKIVKD